MNGTSSSPPLRLITKDSKLQTSDDEDALLITNSKKGSQEMLTSDNNPLHTNEMIREGPIIAEGSK